MWRMVGERSNMERKRMWAERDESISGREKTRRDRENGWGVIQCKGGNESSLRAFSKMALFHG